MPMMKATRRLPYAGSTQEIGDVFEVSDKDVKVLRHLGAELVEGEYETRVMTADRPKRGRPSNLSRQSLLTTKAV